jgi:ElaB/YqjD/DUF883 family membrane-anchored ribosome-binding protein
MGISVSLVDLSKYLPVNAAIPSLKTSSVASPFFIFCAGAIDSCAIVADWTSAGGLAGCSKAIISRLGTFNAPVGSITSQDKVNQRPSEGLGLQTSRIVPAGEKVSDF